MSDLALRDIATADPSGAWAVHGTAVACDGAGVLLLGPSGSGKSATALALMALGARLIADDRVLITDGPNLAAPAAAAPAIEARGVGLLAAELTPGPVPLRLAVSMAHAEPERLPPSRVLDCAGHPVPLILGSGNPNLAPVVLQYLRKGRHA